MGAGGEPWRAASLRCGSRPQSFRRYCSTWVPAASLSEPLPSAAGPDPRVFGVTVHHGGRRRAYASRFPPLWVPVPEFSALLSTMGAGGGRWKRQPCRLSGEAGSAQRPLARNKRYARPKRGPRRLSDRRASASRFPCCKSFALRLSRDTSFLFTMYTKSILSTRI